MALDNNNPYDLTNKILIEFAQKIDECSDEVTLSQILEDFSEYLEHTNLIDIIEYKFINELIKSKRLEIESIPKEENNFISSNNTTNKTLTFNKGGFNPKSVNHSNFIDTTPTTAVSGNRGLVSNAIIISSVIATLIMYALLFIGLIIR